MEENLGDNMYNPGWEDLSLKWGKWKEERRIFDYIKITTFCIAKVHINGQEKNMHCRWLIKGGIHTIKQIDTAIRKNKKTKIMNKQVTQNKIISPLNKGKYYQIQL